MIQTLRKNQDVRIRIKVANCGDPYCRLSFKEIATKLGYWNNVGSSVYKSAAGKYMDIALHGYYEHTNEPWLFYPYVGEELDDLWKNFLRRHQCLRCQKYDNEIVFKRPFCHKCFKFIGKQKIGKINVDPEIRAVVHSKLSETFDKIPPSWRRGTPCFICRRAENHREYTPAEIHAQGLASADKKFIRYSLLWEDEWKCCCEVCLHHLLPNIDKEIPLPVPPLIATNNLHKKC